MKSIYTYVAAAVLGLTAPAAHAQTCAAPTGVTVARLSATSAVVRWQPVAGAVGYSVRYYWVGDSTGAAAATHTRLSSPDTLRGLRANAQYVVQVRSMCGGALSPIAWQYLAASTPGGGGPGTTCAAVDTVRAVPTGSSSVRISFAPVVGALSYTVQVTVAGTSAPFILNQTGPVTSINLSGLQPNTAYLVRVLTNCPSGSTSAAATATFRTLALPAPCGVVSNIVITATSASTAVVSFVPGVGNTGFLITYAAPGDSARWVRSNSSPVTLTGLVPGRTYTVQVSSQCAAGGLVTWGYAAPVAFGFRTGGTLASRSRLGNGRLDVFPNPAQHAATLVLPAVAGATQAQWALLDGLGRPVRTARVPLGAADTQAALDLHGLAAGLYTLRVTAGSQTAVQRLAVE